MRRRDLLRALGAATLAGAAGTGRGQSGSPGGPAGDGDDGFAPLASLPIPGASEAVVGPDGTTAFLAVGDGFAIADVSDPESPDVLAERRGLLEDDDSGPMRDVLDVSVDGDRLLVVGPAHPVSGPRAALLYDVSDPGSPERLAVHRTDYPIHNAVLRDGRAYLTANDGEDGRLEIVDFDGDPSVLGGWSPVDEDDAWAEVPTRLRPVHDLRVRGDLAYCNVWDAGTWIVDVSDPADPAAIGQFGERSPAELGAVEDASVEASELPGNHHSCALDESGELLALGREAWDADGDGAGAPAGIDLVDVSDPGDPSVVGRIEPPPTSDPAREGVWTSAHNFELREGLLYSAWYQGGVRVHDVSDPAEPREVASWRDSAAARFWTAQVGDGVVVASSWGTDDAEAGLFTFPDPASSEAGADPGSSPTEDSPNVGWGTPEGGPATGTESGTTSSPGLPGFGAGAALLGVGLSALLARRGRD